MGIFDKFKKLFKKQEEDSFKKDKKESEIKEEIDNSIDSLNDKIQDPKIDIEPELESEPEIESEPEPELESEPDPEPEIFTDNFLGKDNSQENNLTWEQRLNKGLSKTKLNFFNKITKAVAGKSKISDDILDDIEEALITSDIGVETSLKIIERLEERVSNDKYIETNEIYSFLKEEISLLMKDNLIDIYKSGSPYVFMIVGVNGVGKTTTIGKLAHKFKNQGKKVVLGAADTFRAAAVDQLVIWANRVVVDIVKQKMGSDPASVAFDTLQSAQANNADVVIIDTAGRLHNNVNLMNELSKIKSVMKKFIPEAPHEVMLILDASTGQNAIEQATQFTKATEVDSISLTKLDGSAKGGVVIGISDQFQIPVRFIGVGEGMSDLQDFDKKQFINSLFDEI